MFNVSIKAKLFGLMVFTTFVIIIIGGIGNYIYQTVSKGLAEVIDNKIPVVRNLALIDMLHEGVKGASLQVLLGLEKKNMDLIQSGKTSLIEYQKVYSQHFESINKVESQGNFANDLDKMNKEFEKYFDLSMKVVKSAEESDLVASYENFDKVALQFDQLEKRLEEFGDKYQERNAEYFHQKQSEMSVFNVISWVILVFGVSLSLFLSWYLTHSIIKRLNEVTDTISSSSEDLGISISKLFQSSEQLATAVSEEASALQETAASVEEISAMIIKSTENAAKSNESSIEAKNKAKNGQQVMGDLVHAIEDIHKSNESVMTEFNESNNRINEIVRVIQEIGNKTKVINDIVFQTKLLSFNASVEAARAGENGKGFAVVAEEVGNLAQMSGSSAKEITSLLDESLSKVETIAADSKRKMEALMAKTRETVDRGSEIAKNFEMVLGEIVNETTQASELVNDIAVASQEQSNGVSEISRAVNQLNQSTQINSSAAETSAATSENLKKQSDELRQAASSMRVLVEGRISVPKFIWRDEYYLHVDHMDEEHKILIDKINIFAKEIDKVNGKTSKSLVRAFDDLLDYTIEHFSDEESYMASIKYPQLEPHKEIHQRLLNTVASYKEKIATGIYDPNELMKFLTDWLISHILNVDMKYAEHAKGQPVAGRHRSAA